MSDAVALTGGCLCGAIRYRVEGPVLACGICHCATCRRAAGAESVAWLTVAREHFRVVAGTPASFASSPGVERGFCARCGTSLTFRREDDASIDVTVASLDDPEGAPLRSEWWLEHRLSWNPANPDLEEFPRGGAG
jgi:hypothetical protein